MPNSARRHKPGKARPPASPRKKTAERGYSGPWLRLRQVILSRDPICRMCQREPSAHVDHIKPKADGGEDIESNLQGLCARCHSKKTARERGGAIPRAKQ